MKNGNFPVREQKEIRESRFPVPVPGGGTGTGMDFGFSQDREREREWNRFPDQNGTGTGIDFNYFLAREREREKTGMKCSALILTTLVSTGWITRPNRDALSPNEARIKLLSHAVRIAIAIPSQKNKTVGFEENALIGQCF